MKRTVSFSLVFILCILSAALLAGCFDDEIVYFDRLDKSQAADEISSVEKNLGVSLSGGTLAGGFDSHGGFHYDGLEYVEISLSGDISESIKHAKGWRAFPLPDEISLIIYGGHSGDTEYAPQITDVNGDTPLIPQIKNGYYFFFDKQNAEQNLDPYDYSKTLSGVSVNYLLAVYDSDSKKLYFCEYDT